MKRVALVYNLIDPEMFHHRPLDTTAELDSYETIQALEDALRSGGHKVVRLEADAEIYNKLRTSEIDIVFNIAEGVRGESRESHIPAMCEYLGIPYTGSGVLTTAICLDKARTKEILAYYGLHTARHQVFLDADTPLNPQMRFPLIVKLLHEGSSMGLTPDSVVDDEAALRRQLAWVIGTYTQPAIVEEFIVGREFTVGVLGNDDLIILPIVESIFNNPRGINLFHPDDPILEMATAKLGTVPKVHPKLGYSVVPANVDEQLTRLIHDTARQAYRALGCRDWCRMEMRLGSDDQLYILELNPIAGIDPSYWLPRAAYAAGYTYTELVNMILNFALVRYGLT